MQLTDDVQVHRKSNHRAEALEARLATIYQVSAEKFTERGYNGTTVREIAVAAGLSPAGLMHHFPEKAALLEAVLEHRLGIIDQTFNLPATDGETFLRGLVAAAEHDVSSPEDLLLFTVLSAEALASDHPAHGYFQRWLAEIRRLLQEAFEDLDRRGLYRAPIPPAQAAIQFAAFRDGLNQHWFTSDRTIDLAGSFRACLNLYVALDF